MISIAHRVIRKSHRVPTMRRLWPDNGHKKGMALLVVVVLVMLIALGAYRFSFYMESQYRGTRMHEEQVHARLAAISGIELARAMVELPSAQRSSVGGLKENTSIFRDIAIGDTVLSLSGDRDPNAWRFCLVSPRSAERANSHDLASSQSAGSVSQRIRFGMENEAAKIHIPTLLVWDRLKPGHARMALLGLPGASDTIIDTWLQELGASGQATKGRSEGHNGRLGDVRQAWYGGDLNQNYQLDPLELRLVSQSQDRNRSASQPVGSPNAVVPMKPFQQYLTWHSGHRNATRSGDPRVYLNDPDLASLHRKLSAVWSADWANFAIAIRQFGPGSGVASALAQSNSAAPNPLSKPEPSVSISLGSAANTSPVVEWVQNWSPDFSQAGTFAFRSPLDLVGAVVDLPPAIASNSTSNKSSQTTSTKRILRSPFSGELSEARNYLGRVLDNVTVELSPILVGRIDATEAPVEVLAAVPGLDLSLAQRIVQQRSGSTITMTTVEGLDTIAWLLDIVDIPKLRELEPYLTGRSDVYTVQSIGYRDNQSAVYRITATIDARELPTQVRNQKVWHPWDRGFAIEQLADSKP